MSDDANNLKELGLNKSLAAASTHGDGLAAAILFLKILNYHLIFAPAIAMKPGCGTLPRSKYLWFVMFVKSAKSS